MNTEEYIISYINQNHRDLIFDLTPSYIRITNISFSKNEDIIIHINKYLIKINDEIHKDKYNIGNIYVHITGLNDITINYYNVDDELITYLKMKKRDEILNSILDL